MDRKNEIAMLLEKLEQYAEQGTPREAYAMASRVQAIAKQHAAKKCGDKEQYLTWTIANDAYQMILEENLTAKEALIEAACKHEQEVEAVLAEKSNDSIKMNKTIIRTNEKHPVQKDMQKRRKFNGQGMRNTKNVWQMLNLLSYFREAYKEALDLERVKSDLQEVKTDLQLAKEEIKHLQDATGVIPMSEREKAAILKAKGFKRIDVAKAIGVDRSTVSRWWNNL